MIDLTKPAQSNKVRQVGEGGYEVTLTEAARGKVTIGNTRILFNFVAEGAGKAVAAAAVGGTWSQVADMVDPVLVGTILIAAVLQIGPLSGIMASDWPIPEDYPLIPAWKESLTFEYERVEEKKEEPPPEEVIPEETVPTETTTAEATPEEQPKPKEQPKASSPKPKVAQSAAGSKEKKAAAKSAGRNLVAQKFAVEGGAGGFASNAIGSRQATAMMDNLGKSDMMGPAKGGAASMLTSLGGDGDGTGGPGGTPGLKEIEMGGGGNVVSGGSPGGTGTAPKREQVEVKVKDSVKAQFKGSLSAGEQQSIESIFKKYRSQIENCYKRVISAKGDKRGKLSVIVSLSAKGDVMDVKVHTNEVDPSLEQCVVPKIKAWKFPATGKPSQAMKSWVFGN